MIKNKKLSLLIVLLFMLTIVFASPAHAEILPKVSPTLTGNFTAGISVDDSFEVFLSTTTNIAANTPDTQATYDSDNSYKTMEWFSVNLSDTPQKYYILVRANNGGGIGSFYGTFTLNGTGYKFANGNTTLTTNDTVNWKVSKTGFDGVYETPVIVSPNQLWTAGDYSGSAPAQIRYFVAEIIPVDVTPPVITIGTYPTNPVNTDITITAVTNEGSLNAESHTFTENGSFDFVATDAAGNVTTKTVTIDNIDKVAPTVTSNLDGKAFKLNEKVPADWLSTDINGVASDLGTINKGDCIDTSSAGTKTFNVTAVDTAGNSTRKIITYNVVYVYGGIRQPINSDNSSVFKLGSTVPVKFQLKDYNGNVVTSAASVMPTISISKVSTTVTGTEIEAELTEVAMAGNAFRFDTSDNQYVFNLSTKGLTSGTYEIKITIDNCTEIAPIRISSK